MEEYVEWIDCGRNIEDRNMSTGCLVTVPSESIAADDEM